MADTDSGATAPLQPRTKRTQTRGLSRRILGLAVPALGSLIAEPIFQVIDTAMVGHLGNTPLAGVGVAGAILSTAVGLMIFLAYATTPYVAKCVGAGDYKKAMQAGVNGLFLALGLGIILGGFLAIAGVPLIAIFNTDTTVAAVARDYLLISTAGIPAMMLIFAATGMLRGLLDTRTPLVIAGIGFTLNILLNALFIYGLSMGAAGSAVGTVLAQWGMVLAYIIVINRHLRKHGTTWRLQLSDLRTVGANSGWLFCRTLSLRIAALATLAAATAHSTLVTAGYQVILAALMFVAFALDSIAIAAQSLIGHAIGARDTALVRELLRKMAGWGMVAGGIIAVPLVALSGIIGDAFTSDVRLQAILPIGFIVLAASLPLQGIVYVLDGVLMGAADSRYLAIIGGLNLVVYLPVVWLIAATATGRDSAMQIAFVTGAWCVVYMLARLAGLGLRTRGTKWIATASDSMQTDASSATDTTNAVDKTDATGATHTPDATAKTSAADAQ